MRTLTTFLIISMLLACNRNKTDNTESVTYDFLPRKCGYVSFDNAYRVDAGIQSGNPKLNGTYSINALSENSVKAEDYLMFIQTSNYDRDVLENMIKSPQYDPAAVSAYTLIDEHDKIMENQIVEYLNNNESNSLKSSSSVNFYIKHVEYRLTELKKLNITSSSRLFGEDPGNSLNNNIEIFSDTNGFVFSKDKQIIASIKRGWSIDYYLNLQPIAFSGIYLRMKSVPPEAPLNTKFIVEMEMEGGKILRDTCKSVNLTL